MNIKAIKNQFALAICVAAVFVQFVVFEPYIYQDAFKEFTMFNNNFIWMYSIFFVLGAIVYLINFKKHKSHIGTSLALWGSFVVICGTLSVSMLQTLLRHLKINSITMIMPLIYSLLLCFAATVQYSVFDSIGKKILSEGKSIIVPFCIAIAITAAVLIIVPYHLSYKAVIITSGVLLIAGAFLVDDSKEIILYNQNCTTEENQSKREEKGKTALTLVQLSLVAFGMAILFANIKPFVEYYEYRTQDLCVLYIVVAMSVFAGRKLYSKYNGKNAFIIISAAVFFCPLLIMTFCKGFVLSTIMSAFSAIGGTIQLSYIIKSLCLSNFAHKRSFVIVSIISVTLTFVLGYWTGVYMTLGGGQMTDILAGIYLEPIRTNSIIAKGLMPDSNGVYAEYSGIGERVALSYKRFAYIPSSYVILISAIISEVAFIANTMLQCCRDKVSGKVED